MPNLKTAPKLTAARTTVFEGESVSRDYEPVPGQWYENLEEEEPFRVLTMDEAVIVREAERIGHTRWAERFAETGGAGFLPGFAPRPPSA